MRALLDTNVLVAIATRFSRTQTIAELDRAWNVGHFRVVTTLKLFEELTGVLKERRLAKYLRSGEDLASLVGRLESAVESAPTPTEGQRAYPQLRDPNDAKVLEAAEDLKPDAIVTGDQDLLVLKEYAGIPILSPSQFLACLST